VAELLAAAERAGVAGSDLTWLRDAASSDTHAWNDEFGIARDASQLGVERNLLRYRPVPVTVRIAADAELRDAVRVLAAALAAESTPTVSTAAALPAEIAEQFRGLGATVVVEDDDIWRGRVARLAAQEGPHAGARIRLVAGASHAAEHAAITEASAGKPDIAVYSGDVVRAGRVEMLPHLREQAVSITAHRFGTPNHLSEGLI
jgi:RHH-type proline utilization regulon transcriptional repressor/proline dehydrogenase/delta 1-pyrroline-5-carboxylate dehydrogenase